MSGLPPPDGWLPQQFINPESTVDAEVFEVVEDLLRLDDWVQSDRPEGFEVIG
jgi:hypothetical protein